MKKFLTPLALFVCALLQAQNPIQLQLPGFLPGKTVMATPVKNQGMSGTCWCFSATSLLESQALSKTGQELDLSEMFTVRNIYIEKAKNYILRQGHAQFGEGGLGHDLVRAVALYGAMPESAYSGNASGAKGINHTQMIPELTKFVDSVVKVGKITADWMPGYEAILDRYMGKPDAIFTYNGKQYTAMSFAKEAMQFNADDYVNVTSFTHQPYYKPFVVSVPDNFSSGAYYNLTLSELTETVKTAVNKGYSLVWDADVSNNGFRQDAGLALNLDPTVKYKKDELSAEMKEQPADAATRQRLYETMVTQDDHLMHIVGLRKNKDGKDFFLVKNSWGAVGPYQGYLLVSEPYFQINTITLVVPKAAMSKELLKKLGL